MNVIAHPYATAVFELAKAANLLPEWKQSLALLAQASKTTGFTDLIDNPKIDKSAVTKMLFALVPLQNEQMDNFLQLLQNNGKLPLLADICELYDALMDEYNNTSHAVLYSAVPLSASDVQNFEQLLSKKFAKKIDLNCKVDADLLGGIKVVIGDQVIDASIRGSLNKMATRLI